MGQYGAKLGDLVGEAVLVNPAAREKAVMAVDSYIRTMNNPVSLEAMGTKPLDIVDMSSDERAPELAEIIRRWASSDILKHDVDVVALFPKWVKHESELPGGRKIVLLSPMVAIDPTNYFDQVSGVISWLSDESRQICDGAPDYIVVLPSDWINRGALAYSCYTGTSIMLTETDDNEKETIFDEWNTARHETLHAALISDPEWGYTKSRVETEGTDLFFELLMGCGDDADRIASVFLNHANIFVQCNPDIEKVGGYSEYATYKEAGIRPDGKGKYLHDDYNRQAEYLQGLALSYLIYTEQGGIDGLKAVYKAIRDSGEKDMEKRIRKGVMKGLGLGRKEEENFRKKYMDFCNGFISRIREARSDI